jgi:hypothetical protein
MNVTAQLCGDPPAGRSALDGYRHIGAIDGAHRLYSEAERKERKYKTKRVRGRTKLCEGIEE